MGEPRESSLEYMLLTIVLTRHSSTLLQSLTYGAATASIYFHQIVMHILEYINISSSQPMKLYST